MAQLHLVLCLKLSPQLLLYLCPQLFYHVFVHFNQLLLFLQLLSYQLLVDRVIFRQRLFQAKCFFLCLSDAPRKQTALVWNWFLQWSYRKDFILQFRVGEQCCIEGFLLLGQLIFELGDLSFLGDFLSQLLLPLLVDLIHYFLQVIVSAFFAAIWFFAFHNICLIVNLLQLVIINAKNWLSLV